MNLIDKINKKHINPNVPEFRVGDTVRVNVWIKEGKKERIQAFEGLVIARKGGSVSETFTVRKKKGLAALKLKDGDSLVNVLILKDEDIIISTFNGKVIRIKSSDIGISSRVSQGLVGVKLDEGDYVTGLAAVRDPSDDLAIFTSKGFGKRIPLKDISSQKRGGKGLIVYKPDDTRGGVITIALVNDKDSLLLVGESNSICIDASQIAVTSRVAKGTILIKGNSIVSVSKV